jgi:phage baseplate assembly protein W
MPGNTAFPYHFDPRGRTALTDDETHLVDLIGQVLMTAPGERVNRPDFGSGVLQLAFAPASDTLAATVQYLIQGALQKFLGQRLAVQNVLVAPGEDGTLTITIGYLDRLTQTARSTSFTAVTAS